MHTIYFNSVTYSETVLYIVILSPKPYLEKKRRSEARAN